jgi:hypothetical protein
MASDLWTPAGSAHLGVAPVGNNAETGGKVVAHTVIVKVKDRFGVEHKQRLKILADETTSPSEVEEMMGNAAENFVAEVRAKYTKRRPTAEERKEIGRALNEFNKYAKKRIQSTNQKIYY